MTERDIAIANNLIFIRRDIQGLINFLSDPQQTYCFSVNKKSRFELMKHVTIPCSHAQRCGFSTYTKDVIVDALCKQRDLISKQIKEL